VTHRSLALTYIGGPTALLELDRFRLLTDPTFDPAGTRYETPVYVLRKTHGPALAAEALGPLDAVLLSHDHHFDNLDHAGRVLLADVPLVLTTSAAALRLHHHAVGLEPWASHELRADGAILRVTATPARHGPAGSDRGPVVGFVLEAGGAGGPAVYVSGDTVWFEGVAEVARRFQVGAAVLFLGAARVPEVGPDHLTMTAEEAVQSALAFPRATVVPLHFEGWAHFSENRAAIASAFAEAGLAERVRWPEPGSAVTVPVE
jgi:L-ascorbate metabolism protein UlaG (beta-lactamase superfamily)